VNLICSFYHTFAILNPQKKVKDLPSKWLKWPIGIQTWWWALSFPPQVLEHLQARLWDNQGVSDYGEIQTGLTTPSGLEISSKTLWGMVHQRLKSPPKIVRPPSWARED